MCLAIPAKIVSKTEESVIAEIGEVKREISLMLLPEAEINDFVLVHAGYAIQLIDEEEAAKTLELLKQMDEFYQQTGQDDK